MDSDDKLICRVKESLDKLETARVRTPELGDIVNMISGVEQRKKRRERTELSVFLAADALIFTAILCSLIKSLAVFIGIQVAAAILFPAALFLRFRKHGKRVKV